MRRFPLEDEPRDAGLIKRGIGWLLETQGFNVLVIAVSTGVLVWSGGKVLTQLLPSF